MKALALLLCLSFPAYADGASDVSILAKGSIAPHDGVLMSGEKSIELAKRIKGCEAENAALKSKPVEVPWPVIVAVAVGGVVVGGALGVYVGVRLSQK